ncbi:MAG: methyltransferase domain-containing protein [Bdellovibrionales bacterium]|nr:methyltransferase domain-containing protein [Bdellovibrionales bacterium]
MAQKIHTHLVMAIIEALRSIFIDGYYADKVIERTFKNNRRWGARDRKFVAEAVYEMVRWWRYLWIVSGEEESDYEDVMLNLFGVWWFLNKKESTHFLKTHINAIKTNMHQPLTRAEKESLPDWLDQLAFEELGPAWDEIITALNQRAKLYLRANLLKMNRDQAIKELTKEEIDVLPVEGAPDAMIIPSKKNVFRTKLFQAGGFEVQDVASQSVAYAANVKPGMRVIDACAGAGGKSLHIASLMQNKGKIISLDVHEKKLEQLKIRARRAGANIIETKIIDTTKVIKRLEKTADVVVLDVPCSGLGVLKRNPDTKWKLTKEEYQNTLELQKDILARYSSMTKAGGRLVYSTCSILPSENEKQVENFLAHNSDFKLLGTKTFLPNVEGYDGFFVATMERLS